MKLEFRQHSRTTRYWRRQNPTAEAAKHTDVLAFLSFFAAAFPPTQKDRIIKLHEKLSQTFELDLQPLVRSDKRAFPLDGLLKAMGKRPPWVNSINRSDVTKEHINVLRGGAGKNYLMLLGVLLRRNQATDWAGKNLISEQAAVHHIFPRDFLKENGETRDEYINCIGNLTLINPSTNSEISDTPPEEYLKAYKASDVLERHMIPGDPKLWRIDRYEKFLDARLKLIWNKASAMVDELQA